MYKSAPSCANLRLNKSAAAYGVTTSVITSTIPTLAYVVNAVLSTPASSNVLAPVFTLATVYSLPFN